MYQLAATLLKFRPIVNVAFEHSEGGGRKLGRCFIEQVIFVSWGDQLKQHFLQTGVVSDDEYRVGIAAVRAN